MVAYDFGIKRSILRRLVDAGCRVEVVPAGTPAAEVLARQPDGVFLSNGPGDPAAVAGAPEAIRGLLGEVPVFGICLGHQLLGLALGGETTKLPFGHHGANHPVQRMVDGAVEITSQNHNYAVDRRLDRRRRQGHPRQPQRRRGRGPGRARACGPSRCSTTRRPPPAPTTPPTSSTSSPRLMESRAATVSAQAHRPATASSSSAPGPIVIGQACEFDYSGTQACKVLRAEGYRVILINSNPATIMTDPELADATYVEPLDLDTLTAVIAKERPDALLPTLGGQTALNLAIERPRGRRARRVSASS